MTSHWPFPCYWKIFPRTSINCWKIFYSSIQRLLADLPTNIHRLLADFPWPRTCSWLIFPRSFRGCWQLFPPPSTCCRLIFHEGTGREIGIKWTWTHIARSRKKLLSHCAVLARYKPSVHSSMPSEAVVGIHVHKYIRLLDFTMYPIKRSVLSPLVSILLWNISGADNWVKVCLWFNVILR